jgi:hypothetical protein
MVVPIETTFTVFFLDFTHGIVLSGWGCPRLVLGFVKNLGIGAAGDFFGQPCTLY